LPNIKQPIATVVYSPKRWAYLMESVGYFFDKRALTQNGSDAFRTSANNFLAKGAGATVQHIAFQTDDAVELAIAMAS
jgi:4-hydroxyphenylpyruvate dioxygenase-like putative hemolysin